MRAGAVLGGAPAWVYMLLAALVVLGVRRLRTRDLPVAVALIPVVAFFAWSLSGAAAFARLTGPSVATLVWIGGAVPGALSAYLLPEPRARRLLGGRVRQPGSRMPLALYLTVFVARFACGAWAAIRPGQAVIATGIGVAISAAMAARFATAVLRWRPVEGSADGFATA